MLKRAFLELTQECNLRCIHCLVSGDSAQGSQVLGLDELKKIVDEATALGCYRFILFGGEPLLRADFEEIYSYIYSKKSRIVVATNALLIDEGKIRFFRKYPPELVYIGMYGVDNQTYRTFTGRNNMFDRFEEALDLLKSNKITFKLRMPVLKLNYKTIEKARFIAAKYSAYPLHYIVAITKKVYKTGNISDEILNSEILSAKERVALLNPEHKDVIARIRYLLKSKDKFGRVLPVFKCGAGKEAVYITSSGMMFPCIYFIGHRIGYNILRRPMREGLVQFAKMCYSDSRQRILDTICVKCPFRILCLSCPGRNYNMHGITNRKIDLYCEMTHIIMRRIGILGEIETVFNLPTRQIENKIKNFVEEN